VSRYRATVLCSDRLHNTPIWMFVWTSDDKSRWTNELETNDSNLGPRVFILQRQQWESQRRTDAYSPINFIRNYYERPSRRTWTNAICRVVSYDDGTGFWPDPAGRVPFRDLRATENDRDFYFFFLLSIIKSLTFLSCVVVGYPISFSFTQLTISDSYCSGVTNVNVRYYCSVYDLWRINLKPMCTCVTSLNLNCLNIERNQNVFSFIIPVTCYVFIINTQIYNCIYCMTVHGFSDFVGKSN